MNPVKQIGRYNLPILNVVAISPVDKSGWRRWAFWIRPGYSVMLVNGQTIHFTEQEKHAYDAAMEEHAIITHVWGMCKSAGLRA